MANIIRTDDDRTDEEYSQLTKDLIALVEYEAPQLKTLLQTSLTRAEHRNGDPETNPVRTLPAYYDFVDRIGQLIPRDVLEDPPDGLQDRLLQNCAYFYFLIDQEPLDDPKKDPNPDLGTVQENPVFKEWLHEYVTEWGSFLSTEASWNRTIYRQFYNDDSFGLQEDWYEPASFWETFNDFFSRYLRSPDARPIAQQDDDAVVTSPADSEPQGVWPIKSNGDLGKKGSENGDADGVQIKNHTHHNVNRILGKDSDYHDAFNGGTFTHTFLKINDYHRYHFPVGGTVKEVRQISEHVVMNTRWNGNAYTLADDTGWQFSQTRGSVVIETDQEQLVAVIPIGMGEVSSVNFENHVEPGRQFEKGDMLGHFLFGGSDIVMLFEQELDQTVPDGDHILMGEQYGLLES